MKNSVFLTGATGALGSLLVRRLLEGGHRVTCLVRPRAGVSAPDRMASLPSPHLTVVSGDIQQIQCGISSDQMSQLAGRCNTIVHCAASVNFADEHAARAVNVDGLRQVLTLAERLNINRFCHVSTAYVAGSAAAFGEADRYVGQRWRNAYELSKFVGENMVDSWTVAVPERRSVVYRPSILIGCEDGTSTTFDGYYGYFRTISAAVEAARRLVAGGIDDPTIRVASDGSIHLPLAIRAAANATLNLVPIDWVADMIAQLIRIEPSVNTTYHLVHPRPPLVTKVIRWSLSTLKVTGAKVVNTDLEWDRVIRRQSRFVRAIQRKVDTVLDWFLPYVTGEAGFSMEATRAALGSDYREPADINKHLLDRMLTYAVGKNWGQQ